MILTISGSGVAVYPPGATFGPRRLEDFEFVWLLQGTAEWCYDQGRIALGPNRLLLGRPGIQDSFVWDRTRPTRHSSERPGRRISEPELVDHRDVLAVGGRHRRDVQPSAGDRRAAIADCAEPPPPRPVGQAPGADTLLQTEVDESVGYRWRGVSSNGTTPARST